MAGPVPASGAPNLNGTDPAAVEVAEVVYDFDQAWAERRKKTIPVRIKGRIYQIPGSRPAKFMLFVVRAQNSGRDPAADITEAEAIELLAALVTTEEIEEIAGVCDEEEIMHVLTVCIRLYADQDPDGGDDPGEAGAPNGAASKPKPKPKKRKPVTSSG